MALSAPHVVGTLSPQPARRSADVHVMPVMVVLTGWLAVGGGDTMNDVKLMAVPARVLSVIRPVVAPVGTLVRTIESETTRNAALCPLNPTLRVPSSPLP